MAFHQKLFCQKWKHVTNAANVWQSYFRQTNIVYTNACDRIHLFKRHLYLISALNRSSVHVYRHWSHTGHSTWCNCENFQSTRKVTKTRVPSTTYKTLCSKHGRDFLEKQRWNSVVVPYTGVLPTNHRCISTRQILESCPPRVQPYLKLIRFDKPIGG